MLVDHNSVAQLDHVTLQCIIVLVIHNEGSSVYKAQVQTIVAVAQHIAGHDRYVHTHVVKMRKISFYPGKLVIPRDRR